MADLDGGPEEPKLLTRARRVWLARGLVLVVGAFAAGFVGWSALADHGGEPPAASPRRAVTAAPARAAATDEDQALRRAVGQKIITRMAGLQPSRRLLGRVYRGEVGGVILFAHNARAPAQVVEAVAALQEAAVRGGNPRLLIAVDQEGGTVRRLPWAPPLASAADLGADPAGALGEGERTGRELRLAGVNFDLAPVLDVPASGASFLGTRAFGRTAEAVSRAGCAFAAGLRRGGVFTSGKHFPGLGYATANTDHARVVIRAAATWLRAAYRPYRECRNVLDTVMVSNAAYPGLGVRVPAVFSRAVIEGELRGRVGFRGVVVSDSLQAGAVRHVPGAAVKAARAGVDLLVYPTSERASEAAYRALLSAGRSHPAWRTWLMESARRIRTLKTR